MDTAAVVDEIFRRAGEAGALRVVATDADGTLWEGDVGDALFLAVTTNDRLGPVAREAFMERARALLGPGAPATVPEAARELMARYAAGEVDIRVMCDLQAEALGDRTEAEFDALLAEVAALMSPRVRPVARAILSEARARGFGVHVVSGSVGAAVEAVLRHAGLAFDTVHGATLERRDGRVLPSLTGPIPLHEGKVGALRSAGAWPPSIGLGDGHWDASFLRGAAVPVLVFARPGLRAAMSDHPGVMHLD